MPGYPCCCRKKRPPSNPCDDPTPLVIEDCDGFAAFMECINACGGATWLIQGTFSSADGCAWANLNYALVIGPGGSSMTHDDWVRKTMAVWNASDPECAVYPLFSANAQCEVDGAILDQCNIVHNIEFECVDGKLRVVVSAGSTLGDCWGASAPTFWMGEALFDLPVSMPRSFDLVPASLPDLSCTNEGDTITAPRPVLSSLKLTMLSPCKKYADCAEPVCDGACPGPTASFHFENYGATNSCAKAVVNTSTTGCCSDKLLYIWSDGYVSTEPERPPFGGGEGCGEHEGRDLTLTVMELGQRGCKDSVTHNTGGCCNCDDANGPCDGAEPALVYDQFGAGGPITDCPITEGPSHICAGTEHVWTCDLTLGFSFPKRHACGSFALTVEFDGQRESGGAFVAWFAAGGPDPDTAYVQFTIEGVKFGYAKHVRIRAYLTAVAADDVQDEYETAPLGCDGPKKCWRYLNNPYYPGNSTWDGTDSCAFEYLDPCLVA